VFHDINILLLSAVMFQNTEYISLNSLLFVQRLQDSFWSADLASDMVDFIYSLFQRISKRLTVSHHRIAKYHDLADVLITLAFLGCAILVSVFIWLQKVFLIPGTLALTAVFLSSVSLWAWVYLSIPLTLTACLSIPLTLNLEHLPSDTRTITFLVVISLVLATPILYICIQFMKFGRRSLVSPIRRQNSEQHHQGVEPTPTSLNHPPPACPLPTYTSRPTSLDFFYSSSVV